MEDIFMAVEQYGSQNRLEAALAMERKMSPEKQQKIVDMLQFLNQGSEGRLWAVGGVNNLIEMTGMEVPRGVGDSLVMMEADAFHAKVAALEEAGAEVTEVGSGSSRKLIRLWTDSGVEVVQEVMLMEAGETGYKMNLGTGDSFELQGQISKETARFGESLALPVFVPEDIAAQYKQALESNDVHRLAILEKFISPEERKTVEEEVEVSFDELIYGNEEKEIPGKVIDVQEGDALYAGDDEKEMVADWNTIKIAYTYEDINAIIAHAQATLFEHLQEYEGKPISGTEAYMILHEAGVIPLLEEVEELGTEMTTKQRGEAVLGVLPRIRQVEDLAELNEILEKIVLDSMTFTRDTGNFRVFELQVCNPFEKADTIKQSTDK